MQKVCIIKPNTIDYSSFDNYLGRFTFDKIENDIEDYIKLTNISNETSMIELIVNTLEITPEINVFTTNIYEDEQYVFQMIHLIQYENHKLFENINNIVIEKKKNNIANILCNNLYKVFGNVIITKSKINSDNSISPENITLNDIINVFRKKKVNTGILIKPNNNLEEIEYVGNPLSWMDANKTTNFRYYEIEIMGKIFMFFIEIMPENNILNNFATHLYGGANPIFGNVFLVMRNKPEDMRITENIYLDLFKNTIIKLEKIIKNVNFDKSEEPVGYDHINKKYSNFYNLINEKYKNILKKDINEIIIDYNNKSLNEITQTLLNK